MSSTQSFTVTSSNTLSVSGQPEFRCKRCGGPKSAPGLCNSCTGTILGSSRSVTTAKLDAAEAERMGPQTSFFVLALLAFPMFLAGSLIATSLIHPDYSVGRTLLASFLISNALTTAASWMILFFAVAQTDILSALLSLRSVTRIYRHSDQFWKTMPRLYVLHLSCLAVSVFLTFAFLFTGTFSTAEVAGMVGVTNYSNMDCHTSDCTMR